MPHPLRSSVSPRLATLLLAAALSTAAPAATDAMRQGDFVVKEFRFASGATLPELRLHYRTLGTLHRDAAGHADNAVLILHSTASSGAQFLEPQFAGELFGPGQPLDVTKYFLVLPDAIGHGGSSKPSDGLHAKFPPYRYADMVRAQHQLLTEHLAVDHARLVLGTSMGAMHTWMWGEAHPDFADALMPIASLPVPVAGRNRIWRRMLTEGIRSDPTWRDGDYTTQPQALRHAQDLLFVMTSSALQLQGAYPTRDTADAYYTQRIAQQLRSSDANDLLYAYEASSDYDPQPNLPSITAPLLAFNTADDLINPPELRILQREIRRVPHGRAVVLPASERTHGHSSHSWAVLWKEELVKLLQESAKP